VIPERGLSHNARMKWLVCAALVASTAAQADPLLQPIGLGVAFERVVSECASNCSTVYPDFTVSLAL
jgi:hypothetical protein